MYVFVACIHVGSCMSCLFHVVGGGVFVYLTLDSISGHGEDIHTKSHGCKKKLFLHCLFTMVGQPGHPIMSPFFLTIFMETGGGGGVCGASLSL